jgi:osmoprotectant transport system ATP-binding protein
MIELSSVHKRFSNSDTDAVADLSLTINEGEVVVLVGPSGCGKTTTLRMINRLIEPTSGTIVVAGHPVTSLPVHELRRTIGYVIQQIGLFPHKTIAHNIATVPSLLGWDKDRIAARVDELAELVAIDRSMLDRYPSELSGGQRQRVGVARALAADPPVLLMDEPFGAVDPIVREHLQRELLDLQQRLAKTIVLVTHDIDEAILVGDRVAILNTGGVLEQYASPPDLLAAPANPFVADFLGADRGIKRLSLIPLEADVLVPGPVVDPSISTAEALGVMDREGLEWVLVVDDGRIVGRAMRATLTGPTVGDSTPEPFGAIIDMPATLKDALEAIVSNNGRYAAVRASDRYVGMVSTDAISDRIVV